ncbi:MAG: DUF1646 domain-containing protein [Methanoregulaceae archaeon]|nr:DUF1646 domain-containing protein [Methanoregulaceae archaeon]
MADILPTAGLIVIFAVVLAGPFAVRRIEHNLEVFLLACGAAALTIAGFIHIPGELTGWRWEIVIEALSAPVRITDLLGFIPIGIVQVVLVVGYVFYRWHDTIRNRICSACGKLPLWLVVFILIVALGLLSSIISAIIAAIILIEVLCCLPLSHGLRVRLVVVACFSIGIGAALTPLGEPLSTIAVQKLSGPPYFADFGYLLRLLGVYVLPGIVAYGVLGAFIARKAMTSGLEECHLFREDLREVFMRAAKVYVFITALVLLGEGFKPLILEYVIRIPSAALYWVNTVSAVLDNATLAAAEIGPALSEQQILTALMALLVAGGMLIPGNIPNIIAAGKLKIRSTEWARIGVPIGIASLVVYFAILFSPLVIS